jgi:hypothetical protein
MRWLIDSPGLDDLQGDGVAGLEVQVRPVDMLVCAIPMSHHAAQAEGEFLPLERDVACPRTPRCLAPHDRREDRGKDMCAGKAGRGHIFTVHPNAEREHAIILHSSPSNTHAQRPGASNASRCSAANDTAVQRRAHEGAKRPTRPSDFNGELAGRLVDPEETSVACREILVLVDPARCVSPVNKTLPALLR